MRYLTLIFVMIMTLSAEAPVSNKSTSIGNTQMEKTSTNQNLEKDSFAKWANQPKYVEQYKPIEKKTDFTIGIIVMLFIILVTGMGMVQYYLNRNINNNEEEGIENNLSLGRLRYAFEHKYLPFWMFDNPFNIVTFLMDYREGGIEKWWNIIGKDPETYGTTFEELNVDEVIVFYDHKDNVGFTVIKMPKPVQEGDCYYIGMIVPLEKPLTNSRYITLEYGITDDNKPTTFLCEWRMDGMHKNYGNIVEPRIDLFRDSLDALLVRTPINRVMNNEHRHQIT